MSMLRKIVDEKDAQACLTAVARSGESLRAWAKRHRVDGRSLYAWKRNLARWEGASTQRAPRLVELVPTSRTAQRYVGIRCLNRRGRRGGLGEASSCGWRRVQFDGDCCSAVGGTVTCPSGSSSSRWSSRARVRLQYLGASST